MIVRELLAKFGFQIDTGSVAKVEEAVSNARGGLEQIGKVGASAGERIAQVFAQVPEELAAIDEQAKVLGKAFDGTRERVNALAASIKDMTRLGATAADPRLQSLGQLHATWSAQLAEEEGEAGIGAKLMGHLKETALALGGTMAALFAAEKATENYADFQQTLQKTGAAMRESQAGIDELRTKALDWARELGRSPREIGEAMQELASQGFQKSQVEQMTPIAVKLARAGLTDAGTATEIIGATTRAFYGEDVSKTVTDAGGRKSTAAAHVGDVIAMVHDLGGIKVPQLAESLKYSATTFHALGQSLEDLGSLTAVLGQAGIKDSTAGASLRTMALKLAAPMSVFKRRLQAAGLGELAAHAGKGENMLQVLGLSTSDIVDASGRMRSLVDIIRKVIEKTKGLTMTQRAGVFKQLFGLENATQALAIAQKLGPAFDRVENKTHNATGTLERMYAIMNRGLIPAWQRMMGDLEVLADQLMEALSPALVAVMNAVSGLAAGISQVTEFFGKNNIAAAALKVVIEALKVALIALAPGTLVVGLAALAAFIWGVLIPAVTAWATSTWAALVPWIALTWPIFAVGAAIAALILIVQDLWVGFHGGKSVIFEIFHWLGGLAGKIGAVWSATGRAIGSFLAGIRRTFTSWVSGLLADVESLPQRAIGLLRQIPGIGLLMPALAGGGALAGVTPGSTTTSTSHLTLNLHAPVTVTVGDHAHPFQVGHAVAGAMHDTVRKHLASAARAMPRQVR